MKRAMTQDELLQAYNLLRDAIYAQRVIRPNSKEQWYEMATTFIHNMDNREEHKPSELKEEIITVLITELKKQAFETGEKVTDIQCGPSGSDRHIRLDCYIVNIDKLADAIILGCAGLYPSETLSSAPAKITLPRLKAGTHIADVLHNAVALHELTGRTVVFDFNCTTFVVDGTKSYAQLINEFHADGARVYKVKEN